MSEISALPGSIAALLSGKENLSDLVFVTEYPASPMPVPLEETTVSVGFDSLSITDSFEESGNENAAAGGNEYCRAADINLKLNIHAPFSKGGRECHEAFARIVDTLIFDTDLEIISSGCEDVREDRTTRSLSLKACVRVRANVCPAEDCDGAFTSFFEKTFYCASHIDNASIHLTPGEKSFLALPVKSGVYFGTGEASLTVPLGSQPLFVLVFAPGCPLQSASNESFCAVASNDGGSAGLTIGNGFFTVTNGSETRGVTPALNKAGMSYCYIYV
ncbi:MAG: hypothetical protein K6B52_09570 [Clostridiales bacterium]|nr:hypothetical protein [Clostridiales bacterium]